MTRPSDEERHAQLRAIKVGDATLDDYWMAPSGEGALAYEWSDKPHRLVYDLINEVERLCTELAGAERRAQEGWAAAFAANLNAAELHEDLAALRAAGGRDGAWCPDCGSQDRAIRGTDCKHDWHKPAAPVGGQAEPSDAEVEAFWDAHLNHLSADQAIRAGLAAAFAVRAAGSSKTEPTPVTAHLDGWAPGHLQAHLLHEHTDTGPVYYRPAELREQHEAAHREGRVSPNHPPTTDPTIGRP